MPFIHPGHVILETSVASQNCPIMSFIVVQESFVIHCPEEHDKCGFIFFFCFLLLKEEKSKQCVTGRAHEWAESCHRKEGITATLLHLPTCFFLLIIFPGGKESSQSCCCFAGGASRASTYCLVARVPQCLSWKFPELLLPLGGAGRQPADESQEQADGVLPRMSLNFLLLSFFLLHAQVPFTLTVLSPCREQQRVSPTRERPRWHSLRGHGEMQGWGVRPFLREGEELTVLCMQWWVTRDWTEMCVSLLLAGGCCLHCGLVCWRAEFMVSEKV